MFCVIPRKRSPVIEIPVTFDSASKPGGLGNDKFYLALIVFGVWLFLAIVSLFVDITIFQKIMYILGSFILATLIVRFLIMREPYFFKKREELLKNDFKFPYSTFWNIYEITNNYPYICRYVNGLKSIFVVFDKDVIVGREDDNDYNHYEAISEAYLQMYKRGIDCMHIDYMDTVGKDERVLSLFDLAENVENQNLKEVLTRIYDNVEDIMQHSYASYDVYCFFYNGKDELFLDELEVVINAFLDANYIRYRILNKEEIGLLVKSIMNIDKFSVNYASEKLFTDSGGTHYLKPIWVERNGERMILNKTREELAEEEKVKRVEREMRVNKKKVRGMNKVIKKIKDEEEIDLFDEDYSQGYMDNSQFNSMMEENEESLMDDYNINKNQNVYFDENLKKDKKQKKKVELRKEDFLDNSVQTFDMQIESMFDTKDISFDETENNYKKEPNENIEDEDIELF